MKKNVLLSTIKDNTIFIFTFFVSIAFPEYSASNMGLYNSAGYNKGGNWELFDEFEVFDYKFKTVTDGLLN